MGSNHRGGTWWPFTSSELQVGFGIFGFVAAAAAFAGVPAPLLAWASVAFAVLFYLAGLLVHARRSAAELQFLPDAGIAGAGHLAHFRWARRSLLLMHLDDDPPGDELLALYRRLLSEGIQIRRTVFVRKDALPSAYSWIVGFGDHPNLRQRVVLLPVGSALPMSFAVVDDRTVVLSVPGSEPIDGLPYQAELVLRHLLILRERAVVAAFLRMHEATWRAAYPVADAKHLREVLSDPERLLSAPMGTWP